MVHFYILKCEHRHLCMPSADQALAADPTAPILMEFTVQKRGAFIKEYSEKCKMTIAVSVLNRASIHSILESKTKSP